MQSCPVQGPAAVGRSGVLSGCRIPWFFALHSHARKKAACNHLQVSPQVLPPVQEARLETRAEKCFLGPVWWVLSNGCRCSGPCWGLRPRFILLTELNSAWSQVEGVEWGEESTPVCLQISHLVDVWNKEQFKCELIFCYCISVQTRDGSYKPSCDSWSNKRIPLGSMLHASANKMCLLKANVILVLGQKSADNGFTFLPACLLNG